MMFNSNFENGKKLVPTQKPTQMFGLKFRMQGLSRKQKDKKLSLKTVFENGAFM
jgi:hypothetical protein